LFVYAAFSTWFRHYDRSRPRLRVELPGRPPVDAYLAICMNSNPYTYLGNIPMNLAPDADLDRGLVMATFRSLEMLRFLGLVASVLRRGSHFRRHPSVDYRPDLTEATVVGHGPFPYQVDGDLPGRDRAPHLPPRARFADRRRSLTPRQIGVTSVTRTLENPGTNCLPQ
jgi:hypothetical protein